MRLRSFTIGLALQASATFAKHSHHEHLHAIERRHRHHAARGARESQLETSASSVLELREAESLAENKTELKRGGQCQFPADAGLVAVTPDLMNAGWAMSPDQPCLPGNYCPYACPPTEMMAQWDPEATSYTYPMSMNGGLYCDHNGNVHKPFPNKPYCMGGNTNIYAKDSTGQGVSFCQTVLPGNEAQLIPTWVKGTQGLTTPKPDYWAGTAAHMYINPPGVEPGDACVWGTNHNPWGNWAAYTCGQNTDENGNTFVKVGWNPIYLEPTTPFRNEPPTFGVEVVCDKPGCNGLPCRIDPSKHAINEVQGGGSDDGAGGSSFCVVTVPQGVNMYYNVFNAGEGGNDDGDDDSTPSSSASSSAAPSTTSTPPPSTSETPTSTPTPTPTSTSTTTTATTTTTTPTPTTTSSSSDSSSSSSSSFSSSEESSSTTSESSTTESSSSSSTVSSSPGPHHHHTRSSATTSSTRPVYSPHIMLENGTSTLPVSSTGAIPTTDSASATGLLMTPTSPAASATSSAAAARLILDGGVVVGGLAALAGLLVL